MPIVGPNINSISLTYESLSTPLKETIQTESAGVIDGYIYNLEHAYNCGVDLAAYNENIEYLLSSFLGGTTNDVISRNPVIFPIVFHLVNDGSTLFSNFNISKLLQDINDAFKIANIQFCLATKDTNGNPLSNFGQHEIDLSNDLLYVESGVQIGIKHSEFQRTPGYALSDLYNQQNFDSHKIINVFLINGFSSNLYSGSALSSVSSIPALENIKPFYNISSNNFNITLPVWALGDNGYNFQYGSVSTTIHNYVRKAIERSYGLANYYSTNSHKAKPLITSLGHLFGLSNITSFSKSYDNTHGANSQDCVNISSTCIYNYANVATYDVVGDCIFDTDKYFSNDVVQDATINIGCSSPNYRYNYMSEYINQSSLDSQGLYIHFLFIKYLE